MKSIKKIDPIAMEKWLSEIDTILAFSHLFLAGLIVLSSLFLAKTLKKYFPEIENPQRKTDKAIASISENISKLAVEFNVSNKNTFSSLTENLELTNELNLRVDELEGLMDRNSDKMLTQLTELMVQTKQNSDTLSLVTDSEEQSQETVEVNIEEGNEAVEDNVIQMTGHDIQEKMKTHRYYLDRNKKPVFY